MSSAAISALECRRVCLASLYTTRVRRGPAGRPCVPEDLGLTCICLTMTIRHGQGPEVEGGRRLAQQLRPMCFGSFSAVPAYSHCVVPFDDLCGLVKLNGPCAALAV